MSKVDRKLYQAKYGTNDKGNAWMLLTPHYDEVKALEMIRQGVDPTTAYKQCLVETVGPELAEVPFRR